MKELITVNRKELLNLLKETYVNGHKDGHEKGYSKGFKDGEAFGNIEKKLDIVEERIKLTRQFNSL